jgi:hypothetical protein
MYWLGGRKDWYGAHFWTQCQTSIKVFGSLHPPHPLQAQQQEGEVRGKEESGERKILHRVRWRYE